MCAPHPRGRDVQRRAFEEHRPLRTRRRPSPPGDIPSPRPNNPETHRSPRRCAQMPTTVQGPPRWRSGPSAQPARAPAESLTSAGARCARDNNAHAGPSLVPLCPANGDHHLCTPEGSTHGDVDGSSMKSIAREPIKEARLVCCLVSGGGVREGIGVCVLVCTWTGPRR